MLRFGTDGVRGVANSELTPELVLALGRAAARILGPRGDAGDGAGGGRRRFVIGRDTRRSGPLLAAALAAGVASEGVDVVDAGVIPTPGVAALCRAWRTPGAVISASHNPFPDNGVKLFAPGGRKLDDATEESLESALEALLGAPGAPPAGATPTAPTTPTATTGPTSAGAPTGAAVGAIAADPSAAGWYRGELVAALEGRRLDGLRVVVDCGHGASVVTAPDAVVAAGADVVEVIGNRPDGTNINAGAGSTSPAQLSAAVVAHRADAGLAFDGDADRVIAVDDRGQVVDGDRLLALFAGDLAGRGRLAGKTVVVTVMTNLGFHQAMAAQGIAVHTTPVGDRAVLEALDAHGWSLGGEQSGHIIFRDLATTGDGALSGLLLLDLLARSGQRLSALAADAMTRMPQVLVNVQVADPAGLDGAGAVWEEVKAVEAALGRSGRVLLRRSGTEPLVRVMVEAPTEVEAEAGAARIAGAVKVALAGC
jgi:phosphoglucosamine mutase